jgi:hypothetical protein
MEMAFHKAGLGEDRRMGGWTGETAKNLEDLLLLCARDADAVAVSVLVRV